MTKKQFIEKAIKGGFKSGLTQFINEPEDSAIFDALFLKTILDPKAWQAVGKVEGWKTKCPTFSLCDENNKCKHDDVKIKMHQMIDALIAGKTIKEFLETL